jgi:plastocyanin
MRVRRLSAIAVPIAAAGALAAPATAGGGATITFRCCNYTPPTVTIARGESVSFRADPGHDFQLFPGPSHHPLKFVGNAQPAQTSGTTTSRRFDRAGKFGFYCVNHASVGMVGLVKVEDR